jgi:DNA-binding FrmR family transcriptional regulator
VNNDFTLMGLWHADESNGTAVADSSGKGHLGNIVGTVSRSTGKFGNALTFDGSGGYVSIDNSSFLEPTVVSVEAWVKPGAVDSRVVFDKRTAGTGYSLGTDANGKPYFWVDEVVATSFAGLQPDNWYHLAGVYDGSTVKIYVNGDMMGSAAGSDLDTTGNDASIGIGYSGGNVAGAVDEVAVWGRALNAEEIADHARSGAGTLRVHVKFANDTASLDALPFIGWDGTSNTYYTAASGSSLLSLYPLGQYFQYRVALTAEDGARAPVFQGATVNQTGYPINNPWVTPATGYGRPFLGTLTALSHILATNTEDAVRYQISGNNGTNWYWWNGGQWDYISSAVTNTDTLWTMANSRATVDAHIGTFYDDLYAKTGGVFKFKAYLKSDAVNQVALDEVKLLHAPGRIVVTVPNGQEVGNDAWLIGVPYNITWSSTGTVSGQLMLERSLDGGNGWTLIASNVPNTGVYSNWPTPSTPSSQCRVRITDQNDAFITDKSDADFSLVQRYRVTAPNGGEKWYSGRSYLIKWWSAIGLGTLADIHYASDGANFSYLVKSGADNTPGGVTNAFLWQTPPANAALLSEAGKIRIKTFGGSSGIDESDYGFTLAGVEITRPPAGALVNRRSTYPIEWYSAGASNAVKIEFSSNGGGSWTNVTASSPNVAGANTYDWTPNVPPTDTARLRITSLSDSNVVGVTSNFVLADVDIVAPTNGTIWGMRLTNSIVWMAGGAGTNANLYYSTNSGVRWTPIVENYRTYSGSNSYRWLVEPYPGSHVRIKIESLQDTNLYAISEDFKIAGVRVVSPNGDEKWQLDMPNTNKWAYQSVGESATLEFSYDGGITYRTIGGPGVPLINEALEYTPTYPTIRARTKIIADDPAPFTNMVDVSDKDFIVGGILVKTPSNSSVYTLGFSGPVEWVSAGADDPLGQARLSYSADGVTNDIITTGNSDSFPGDNSYQWAVNVQSDPSASARVIVRSGPYTGFSSPFVLRGIKFSSPNASSIYSGGSVGPLVWKSAGIDESALGYFYLSTDGGVNFGATPLNVSQVWPVISGAYPWSIDVNEDPTTNAVVKYVVASSAATQDVGYAATTLPFVLRGFKFIAPLSGAVWKHNTTNAIVWRSARAGSVVSLYYSADGATYDAVPIAANVPLIDGVTNYAWRVEPSRMPSTNARVKAVTSVATTISQPFTVQGIKVLYPLATDIWALDETNRISWVGVGSTPPYTISLIQGGTNVMPIASGVFNTEYDWVVPLAAIGSNSVIRVTDGTFTGDSLPFRIVGMPTVEIIAPAPGDLWKVSQPYNIVWSKGGKMENNFRVMFSRDPYVATNDIFNGIASYNPIDNTYSLPDPWIVPDRLGNTRIIVQHNLRSDIWDVSETFKIVPYFRLAYPNGGETNLYARKPHTIVSWFTRGSQGLVDLYYSADPLHASNSWVKINDTPIANNGEGLADIVTTYDWTIADLGGDVSSVRLRVAATDEPGAYDDSDSDFSILYFKIRWNVYDAATLNPLTQLSVSDSSGWSEANLISPVQRAYPYGIFSTVWAREFYNNNVIFNWESDPSRTINVPMSFSSVDPDYNVMASFEYDTSNAVFRVNTWIERRGVILPTPTRSIVTLFDASGNTAGQVTSSTYDPSGVFWMTLPGTLARGSVYFAKVEIEFSGTVYSSGLTFNLRVPTDDERVQQILSGVNSVGTNLTNLAVAQALFRASATEKLDLLTNATVSIQAGVTNIEAKLDLLSTQALAQLTAITNTIGVIGPGETNILDLVKRLPSSMGSAQREARILTRPTTVKYGSSVNVLYRTLEGMTATYQVLPAGGGAAIRSGPMGGGVGGIYEATLTADWGYGDYQIVCADSSSPVSSDRMIVKVTSMELDDLAGTVVSISGQVSRVEETLTDMRGVQSNIYNIVGTLDDLTNLVSQVQIMTNAMEKIAGLTNMSGQLNFMTNLLSEMAVVTNVAPQIASITNMMGLLAPVTNFGPQIAYMTNVVGQLTAMTNIGDQVAVMTNAMDKMSGLTNMSGQLNYLTNMVGQLGPLTNLASQLGGLTGMASQVTFLTNVVGQLTAITNIGDQVAVMTNSLARVAALTNINEQMSYVTNVIGSLGSITNLGPQVDALNAAIGQIVALTNMANQVDYLVSVIDQVVAVTNITPQIAILTNSLTQITALTNMSGQLTFLADTMTQMVGLTNMPSQLALMTNTLTQFAGLTNVAFQMSYVTNVIGQLTGVTNISAQVADMTNAIGRVAALTNMSGQLSYMTNIIGQLSGVTNIAAQVSDMTNSIAKVAALTNMSGQLSYMTNVIGQLSGITNISAQVADMTNALGRVAGLTNMSDQLRYMTNVIGQLAGMTNISAQVAVMTNAIGQLSGITNISAQVATITNALAGLVGLGDVPGQLSYVTNVIGSLSAATNLGTQIATMTNAIASLSAMTNMATDVAQVGSNVTVMMNEVAGLGATYEAMTSMQGVVSNVEAMAVTMETRIGREGDTADSSTVFGMLSYIEEKISQSGADGTGAILKGVNSAKGAAQKAASAASKMKDVAGAGKLDQVLSELDAIQRSLSSVKGDVEGLPESMTTEAMVKVIKQAMDDIRNVAGGRGLPTEGIGQTGGALEAGSLSDPQSVSKLLNSIAETKAMMQAMQGLMDEAVNKPVVVDWLEGGTGK